MNGFEKMRQECREYRDENAYCDGCDNKRVCEILQKGSTLMTLDNKKIKLLVSLAKEVEDEETNTN